MKKYPGIGLMIALSSSAVLWAIIILLGQMIWR